MYIKLVCSTKVFKEARPGAVVQTGFQQRQQELVPAFSVSVEFKNWASLPNKPLVNWKFFLNWQRRRMRMTLVAPDDGAGPNSIREAAATGRDAAQPGGPRAIGKVAKNAGNNAAAAEAETEEEDSGAEDWDSEYDIGLPASRSVKPASRPAGGATSAMPDWEITGGTFSVPNSLFNISNFLVNFFLYSLQKASSAARRRKAAGDEAGAAKRASRDAVASGGDHH